MKILKNLRYLAPYGLVLLRERIANQRNSLPLPTAALEANKALQGTETGRCFILGNGPSVKGLDLSVLAGETVISVSSGYLHRDYMRIHPRYHCVPQITYGKMTEDDVVLWFNEMHEHIGNATLFLNETEMDIVRRNDLFPGRQVHYLALRENFDELHNREIINIAESVPCVASVPIMSLMIAMYLGFKNIFLLGIDHDHFKSDTYIYAFELLIQKGKDFSVTPDGNITTSRYDDFQSLARLWRQYRILRHIAEHNDIHIFNATPGGELDEFPRILLTDVVEKTA